MPYVKIYEDRQNVVEMLESLQKFFDENGYFEASSWVITRNEEGKLVERCCSKHPENIYENVGEWFKDSNVYPDQKQWKD